MIEKANPWRGEIGLDLLDGYVLFRPSFEALVAAEGEIGSLFGFVEKASESQMKLADVVALFWNCSSVKNNAQPPLTREAFSEALIALGMAQLAPVLKHLIGQILQGR